METEKITINVVPVDLGKIDLLVAQGLYASRSDMIRTAIRRELDQNDHVVREAIVRDNLAVGVTWFGRSDLERARKDGVKMRVRVIGMLTIAKDVPAKLATDVFESVRVLGALRASDEVVAALG